MRSVRSILLLVALLVTGACGDKTAAPTAPTPVAETPASSTVTTPPSTVPSPGATIAGTITMPAGTGTFGARTITTTVIVQVAGTDLSAIVGAQGNFELRGVPAGDVTLRISGMGVDTSVAVGILEAGEAVQLAIVVSGTVPLITADSRLGHGQSTEIEGTIVEKQAPNRIVVRSQLVEVAGSTVIRYANQTLTYADLAAGQRVHVRGVVSVTVSSTIVVADAIDVQSEGPPPTPPAEIMVRGSVVGISGGSCDSKNLSFTVAAVGGGTKLVQASASTAFSSPTSCVSIKTGAYVEATGAMQAGSDTLLASKIYVADAPTPITFTGTVGSLTGGSCGAANLTFDAAVAGITTVTKHVQTSSTTAFSPSCAAVVAGAKVTVEGMLQEGYVVVASKVTVAAATPTSISGVVSGFVATSCPAVTFSVTVTGVTSTVTTVQASSSTVFSPGCTLLKDGDKVKVEGTKPADKLLATSVTRY